MSAFVTAGIASASLIGIISGWKRRILQYAASVRNFIDGRLEYDLLVANMDFNFD